jgi:hypothetical protein
MTAERRGLGMNYTEFINQLNVSEAEKGVLHGLVQEVEYLREECEARYAAQERLAGMVEDLGQSIGALHDDTKEMLDELIEVIEVSDCECDSDDDDSGFESESCGNEEAES